MRTETIALYSFAELNEDAQQTAIENARHNNWTGDHWDKDYRKTLEKFADHIGVRLTDWEVSPYSHSFVRWDATRWDDEHLNTMTPARLATWVYNNWMKPLYRGQFMWADFPSGQHRYSKCRFEISCPFTGFCADETILHPLQAFVKKPSPHSTIRGLVDSCFAGFVREWVADIEHQTGDEYIADFLTANDYEFTANGAFW